MTPVLEIQVKHGGKKGFFSVEIGNIAGRIGLCNCPEKDVLEEIKRQLETLKEPEKEVKEC